MKGGGLFARDLMLWSGRRCSSTAAGRGTSHTPFAAAATIPATGVLARRVLDQQEQGLFTRDQARDDKQSMIFEKLSLSLPYLIVLPLCWVGSRVHEYA